MIVDTEKEIKEYELAVLAVNETAEADLNKILTPYVIGGENNLKKEPSQLVNLAYPIKKHVSAVLLVYQFPADPSKINGIKSSLKFNKNILRLLIITPPIKSVNVLKRQKNQVDYNLARLEQKSSDMISNQELTKTLEQLSD